MYQEDPGFRMAPQGDYGQLGAWYNNWSDLWGNVRKAADWVSGAGRSAQVYAQGAQNVANNLENPAAFRVDATTAILGAVAVGTVVWAVTRKRNKGR